MALFIPKILLKGAAGDLTIKGNTNLVEEVLDYKMSYKPNITSSLPAIAGVLVRTPGRAALTCTYRSSSSRVIHSHAESCAEFARFAACFKHSSFRSIESIVRTTPTIYIPHTNNK